MRARHSTLNNVKGDGEHLGVMVGLMREHKGYKTLNDRRGRSYATYEGYCVDYPSVRKAALEAGIIRPTITLPLDPIRAAKLLRKHFKGEALAELIRGHADGGLGGESGPEPMTSACSVMAGCIVQ